MITGLFFLNNGVLSHWMKHFWVRLKIVLFTCNEAWSHENLIPILVGVNKASSSFLPFVQPAIIDLHLQKKSVQLLCCWEKKSFLFISFQRLNGYQTNRRIFVPFLNKKHFCEPLSIIFIIYCRSELLEMQKLNFYLKIFFWKALWRKPRGVFQRVNEAASNADFKLEKTEWGKTTIFSETISSNFKLKRDCLFSFVYFHLKFKIFVLSALAPCHHRRPSQVDPFDVPPPRHQFNQVISAQTQENLTRGNYCVLLCITF